MAKWQALQAGIRGTRVVRWWNDRPAAIRFTVRAAALMAIFYSVLYYPYGETSLPGRLLSGYLAVVARISGGCLLLFDSNVHVEGTYITGRNSLQIVLDCAALDALALFGATLLAFPASIRVKAIGIFAGIAVISGFNLLRIIILYVAAVSAPEMFEFLHEDVMALMMVFVSVACFAAWAVLARNRSAPRAIHASTLA